MLLLEGFTYLPHIFQALGAKEKRPIQSCAGDNFPIPTSPFHPLPLYPQCWIWYLFRAGRCVLGVSQSVLGCLIWKTKGRSRLVTGTLLINPALPVQGCRWQGCRTLSPLSPCPLWRSKQHIPILGKLRQCCSLLDLPEALGLSQACSLFSCQSLSFWERKGLFLFLLILKSLFCRCNGNLAQDSGTKV